MKRNRTSKTIAYISTSEHRRRKREGIIIVIILAVVSLVTFAENRLIDFGGDIPISNTILMFILININILLLILLCFLVFRNLVKLLYDRKRKVMGSKLRTRLVVAFVSLTILPTLLLFFFSINFITSSIEFWFNVPVEQALENSLRVGRSLYDRAESNNQFYLKRVAYQIKSKKYLDRDKEGDLTRYIRVVQREFNFYAAEIYNAKFDRLAYALNPKINPPYLKMVTSADLKKGFGAKGIRTLSDSIDNGELLRTVGTVPFGAGPGEIDAFVVLSLMIPSTLSENMASISRGFEEYQQIKLLKQPIKTTYYITISIVCLVVLFGAIWFAFFLAKSITIPIMELAKGTRRVAEGDLSFTITMVADDEIGTLVSSFNKMTRDLRIGREQLNLSTRMLREQNIELEERRQYIEIVLKNVSAGVVTLDAGKFVSTINKSAERMLNLKAEDILRKSYKKLLKGSHLKLAEEVLDNLSTSPGKSVELTLRAMIASRPQSFMIHVNALRDDSGHQMGMVVVFDDLTDLEKAQRMAAWREVARRIAHEVKNPLTPISLSAQRLKRRYSDRIHEPVFDECTKMIIDHVELIRNLVNEFSAFARFPTANPKRRDLAPIIEETIALYREGHPNISFEFEVKDTIPQLNLDRQQIKQAIINLIDNAISALKESGDIHISLAHDPILNRVRLEIADNGPGISDEDKTRLFEPNFSTKKTGMGLGLTIVSTIMADHNGMVRVQDNQPQGAKFVIELPV